MTSTTGKTHRVNDPHAYRRGWDDGIAAERKRLGAYMQELVKDVRAAERERIAAHVAATAKTWHGDVRQVCGVLAAQIRAGLLGDSGSQETTP